MIHTFLTLFLAFTAWLQADETIFIELETESPLLPLYLSPLYDQGSGFEGSYLEKLREVLSYDLNYNGMTRVVEGTKGGSQILQKVSFEERGERSDLEKLGSYFVVKAKVQNKKLSLRLIVVNSSTMKTIDGVELSGTLSKDRQKIHKVADTIFKNLFGADGVASTHILYTKKVKGAQGWVSEVYEADWDGENERSLTQGAGYVVTPCYAPAKKGSSPSSFFYVSYKNGQPKIFHSPLNAFRPTRFSLLKGNQLMPALSQKRNQVAFISDITGNPDLFLQSIEADGTLVGKPSQIFATRRATQGTPSFSPDGKKIAFVSNKDGAPRIYVIDVPAPGTPLNQIRAELITRYNKENTAPAWSYDGKKIAYTALVDGTRQICIYDFEKRKERQLTKGPGHKENPTWAPNSLHLAFNAEVGKESNLFVVNLNQPQAIKISRQGGDKRFPSWEPRL